MTTSRTARAKRARKQAGNGAAHEAATASAAPLTTEPSRNALLALAEHGLRRDAMKVQELQAVLDCTEAQARAYTETRRVVDDLCSRWQRVIDYREALKSDFEASLDGLSVEDAATVSASVFDRNESVEHALIQSEMAECRRAAASQLRRFDAALRNALLEHSRVSRDALEDVISKCGVDFGISRTMRTTDRNLDIERAFDALLPIVSALRANPRIYASTTFAKDLVKLLAPDDATAGNRVLDRATLALGTAALAAHRDRLRDEHASFQKRWRPLLRKQPVDLAQALEEQRTATTRRAKMPNVTRRRLIAVLRDANVRKVLADGIDDTQGGGDKKSCYFVLGQLIELDWTTVRDCVNEVRHRAKGRPATKGRRRQNARARRSPRA